MLAVLPRFKHKDIDNLANICVSTSRQIADDGEEFDKFDTSDTNQPNVN
jgi:hypothetical protein